MPPSQNGQLENAIDEVLKSGNVQTLESIVERDDEESLMKCSQRFLTKLDKLISTRLDQKDARTASLGLASIYKYGKYLKLPGGEGLPVLINQGFIKKWFEKCQQLWIHHGPHWDETMFTLAENFLNVLMGVHESCKEGTCKVTESFLYPVGQLAVDPRIYILIQKEAIRKYNLILDKIPVEFKKNRRLLTSQEGSDIMTKLAARILEGGDYDLQSSLMEALCRMATSGQRKKLADHWFSMEQVACAFAQISDSEFETACRRFLNMVNGMQGDKRRVYSYPCLEVYLGKYELLMPLDEKLKEFWIDFNLCSQSISFYFSLPDEEEGHWETICINENEVQSYTVTEKGKTQVLQINLSEVVVVGAVEGANLSIHFSSSLDVLQAAKNVFGQKKGKHTLIVKTAGKTMIEENSTQVVPESQLSHGESEKNTAPYVLSAPAAPAQMVTPARMRMSESTAYISTSEGGSVYSISSLALKLSTKDKDKTSLAKICSRDTNVRSCSYSTTPSNTNAVDIKKQKMPLTEAEHVGLQGEEKCQEHYFIPDTQLKAGCSTSSSWNKLSVSEMLLMPTQKIGSLPRPESNSSVVGQQEHCPSSTHKLSISDSSLILQKQLHSELTQRLEQVLSEKKKDPQYEAAAALEKKMSNTKRTSKKQSSENMRESSLYTPKVQHVQKNHQRCGESKGQTALKADTVPTKTSLKTSSVKRVQDTKESKDKQETNIVLANKETRDTKVTSSMLKLISSHYEITTSSTTKGLVEKTVQNWIPPVVNRPIFNMKVFSSGKKEVPKTVSPRKSFNKATKSTMQRKDIFAFNIDLPVFIGVEKKVFNKTLDTSNRGIQSSPRRLSTAKKAQLEPVEKKKRYVRKHLFSDTDTDNAMTEVSWLKESSRKPKPQVTKYTRQPVSKPKAAPPQSTHKSPDLPPAASKARKGNNRPRKMAQDQPKTERAAALSRPRAAARRPKRAAAASTKSYIEPDTEDSQPETEGAHAPKLLSTDKLKNDVIIQEATQTKKKTTANRQPTKMKQQPASEILTTSKTRYVGKQENSKIICSKKPQVEDRKIFSDQPAESCRRQDSCIGSNLKKQSDLKVKLGNVVQEISKLKKKNVILTQEQMSPLKDSLAAFQTSSCPSPPFIEEMRSAERSAPALHLTCSTVLTPWGSPLSASPKPPCQETPSPVPLLPKPHLTVSSKRTRKTSFYIAKNHISSKTKFIRSVSSSCSSKGQTPAPSPPAGPKGAEMHADQQHLSSAPRPVLSPTTLPLLTSTVLELDKPPVVSPLSSPLPEDTVSYSCHPEFSKVSSVSLGSLSHSSSKSSIHNRKKKNSSFAPVTVFLKTEKTPDTDRDLELMQPLVSGPSRKRHVSFSNSEEDEKENIKKNKIKTHRSPRMKPRKLFKSFAEVSTVEELSNISSSNWEVDMVDGDMDMDDDLELPEVNLNPNKLCQQMNSELKNKFQNRCKMMEIYNKQSLKTVHQHVSSINVQLTKYRTQRLEQVQKVLLEEINKMEQDDSMLKNMEKDLSVMWKKQVTAFHSYQKQEIGRNDTLKKALQSNVRQNLEYEEGVFTSEMGLIRNEMKSVQDSLLNEMLEGEVQSVKRGLRALFFP